MSTPAARAAERAKLVRRLQWQAHLEDRIEQGFNDVFMVSRYEEELRAFVQSKEKEGFTIKDSSEKRTGAASFRIEW